MSITIHLASAQAPDDPSADIGSPSRCGAVNFANINAVAVLRVALGCDDVGSYGGIGHGEIVNAIGRIGAALAPGDIGDALRSPMVSPANDHPDPRVILQPQTNARARDRLLAMLALLAIALARGEGGWWS